MLRRVDPCWRGATNGQADWGGVLSGRHNLAGTSTTTRACVVGGYNNSATELYRSSVAGAQHRCHQYTPCARSAEHGGLVLVSGSRRATQSRLGPVRDGPRGYADSAEGPYSFATTITPSLRRHTPIAAFNGRPRLPATSSDAVRSPRPAAVSDRHPLDRVARYSTTTSSNRGTCRTYTRGR